MSDIRARSAARAEAAPRMACRFAEWCVAGTCDVPPPGDFVLVTRGEYDRAYLRMAERSGDLSLFVGETDRFARAAREDARWPRRYMHTQSGRGIVNIHLNAALDFVMTYALRPTDTPDLGPASGEGRGTCAWIVEEAA
ncbi:hypothetical protein [Roseobacter sp. HKCCA0434]|uniref:hypothetical protein n=1 Tax=Roseobacter sp. HKCCA0434 TaxID=3079297 RepID=UPI002905BC4C|nr:hypothetical protein [Roseobacter sp. HKCCA0434]